MLKLGKGVVLMKNVRNGRKSRRKKRRSMRSTTRISKL